MCVWGGGGGGGEERERGGGGFRHRKGKMSAVSQLSTQLKTCPSTGSSKLNIIRKENRTRIYKGSIQY